MGVFWMVINPLLLLAVFTFIFVFVFKAKFGSSGRISVSALYILCGILPWLAFQEGIARAGNVVVENRNLVTRARFPLSVLPAYPVLASLLGQLAGFGVLLALSAGGSLPGPGPSLIVSLPLLLALQVLLTLGLALMVAGAAVYIRDVNHIMPVLLMVWFYGTPVFYPAELVPESFKLLVSLNPLAQLISAYRAVILEGAWPQAEAWTSLAGSALVAMAAGGLLFQRLRKGFADRL
jgi:ABC-type polysaccharide/polyol phosphate export permease